MKKAKSQAWRSLAIPFISYHSIDGQNSYLSAVGKLKLGIPIGCRQTMGACNPLGASEAEQGARSFAGESKLLWNEQVKERSKRLRQVHKRAVDDGRVALALEVRLLGLLGHFST